MLLSTFELTPAIRSLAFILLFVPGSVLGQVMCDNDLKLEFKNEIGGVITLSDVRSREITGTNRNPIEQVVFSKGTQSGSVIAGKMRINSLKASDFPDSGIPMAAIDRSQNKFWEINIPNKKYNFADKNDLKVEVTVTVKGKAAYHVSGGRASSAELTVNEGKIVEKWYGNSGSLKQLQGSLDFLYSDLLRLGVPGVHRAQVEICVNIRGNL